MFAQNSLSSACPASTQHECTHHLLILPMWRCTGRRLHGLAHHAQLRPHIITGCARRNITCSAQRGAGGIRSAAGMPLHFHEGEGRNGGSSTVSAAEEPKEEEEERTSQKEAPEESSHSSSAEDMRERLRSILPPPPPPPSEEALKLQLLMELTGYQQSSASLYLLHQQWMPQAWLSAKHNACSRRTKFIYFQANAVVRMPKGRNGGFICWMQCCIGNLTFLLPAGTLRCPAPWQSSQEDSCIWTSLQTSTCRTARLRQPF